MKEQFISITLMIIYQLWIYYLVAAPFCNIAFANTSYEGSASSFNSDDRYASFISRLAYLRDFSGVLPDSIRRRAHDRVGLYGVVNRDVYIGNPLLLLGRGLIGSRLQFIPKNSIRGMSMQELYDKCELVSKGSAMLMDVDSSYFEYYISQYGLLYISIIPNIPCGEYYVLNEYYDGSKWVCDFPNVDIADNDMHFSYDQKAWLDANGISESEIRSAIRYELEKLVVVVRNQ